MKFNQEIATENYTISFPNEAIEYNGHHYILFTHILFTQGMYWNEAKEY